MEKGSNVKFLGWFASRLFFYAAFLYLSTSVSMNGLIAVVDSTPGYAGFPLVAKHQSGKLCSDVELKNDREYCEMLTLEINGVIKDPVFLKGARAYKRLSTREHVLKVVLPYHISRKEFLDYRLASVLPIEAEARVRHTIENKKLGKVPDSHFISEGKQSLINKQIEIVDDLSLGSMVFGVFLMGAVFLIAGLLGSLFAWVYCSTHYAYCIISDSRNVR